MKKILITTGGTGGHVIPAQIIQEHIIEVTEKAFDDFADSGMDKQTNKKILGIN